MKINECEVGVVSLFYWSALLSEKELGVEKQRVRFCSAIMLMLGAAWVETTSLASPRTFQLSHKAMRCFQHRVLVGQSQST